MHSCTSAVVAASGLCPAAVASKETAWFHACVLTTPPSLNSTLKRAIANKARESACSEHLV